MIYVQKLCFKIWLILIVLHKAKSSSDYTTIVSEYQSNECSQLKTYSSKTEFIWPKLEFNNSYCYSTPVCLDELKFPKYRYYNNNCMDENRLTCSFVQNVSLSNICANGEPAFVDEFSKICFSNSSKINNIWDYTPCMLYGLNIDFLGMESMRRAPLLKFLAENYGTIFWLPLRRELSYQPSQYYVPIIWKTYKTFDWLGIWGFNGDCVSMEIVNSSEILLKYDNCNNRYPMLCGYNQTNYRKVEYNKNTFVMNTFPNFNKYFYVHKDYCPYGKMSVVDSFEKKRMYQQLLANNNSECTVSVFSGNKNLTSPNIKQYNSTTPCGDNCAIGITDWVNRFNEIEFVNWKADDIGSGRVIVVDSTGGWKLKQRPLCTICEDEINQFEITELLLYEKNDNEIVLVINVVVLITNSDNDNLDNLFNFKEILGINCFGQYSNMQFENFDKIEIADRIVNTFPPRLRFYKEIYIQKVGRSGHFWCEGYSVIHNRVFSTNQIYVELGDRTENYAVITKVRGIVTEIDQARIQFHANTLKQLITSNLQSYGNSLLTVNFKIIISINYLLQEMLAVVHLKVSLPDEDQNFDDQLLIYKSELWKALQTINGTNYRFYGLNHTRYCLPENITIDTTILQWGRGQQNQFVNTKNFDLEENGVPIVRYCVGNFEYGVQWISLNEMNVRNSWTANNVTKELHYLENMLSSNNELSIKILKNFSTLIKTNREELISADLFTIGKVLSHLTNSNFTENVGTQKMDSISEVTCIVDICIQVNNEVAHNLHMLNTTNTILYSFEKVLSNMFDSLENNDEQVNITATNILVFVLNPALTNISGLAVYKNLSKIEFDNDFSDYYIENIYANATLSTFAEGFTIASHVPQDLLDNLLQLKDDLQIIITLYYSDVLYQDEENGDELDSIVISVSIPDIPNRLAGIVSFYFTSKSNSYYKLTSNASLFESNYCSFWNFQPKNETKNSEWSQDGCYFMGFDTTVKNTTQISICGCKHLTSFAFLVGDLEITRINEVIIVPTIHGNALDMITLMGCTLSILGVLGIFLTAFMFPTFRRKSGIKILLQLSTAIALQMVLTVFVTTRVIDFEVSADMEWTSCLFYGATLHYSVLVVFAWMLISAYLQFNRYVRVFNTKSKYLVLISSIIGWIVPIVPVMLGIFISPESYSAAVINLLNVCYPTGYTLIFAVILPISVIVGANLIIFILVMYNIFKMASNKIHAKEKDIIVSQLRLSVFLFFLLGLTWTFGLANTLSFGIAFSYLFCLTASVQGMVLFIYFVIMDPETRLLWSNCLTMRSFQEKMI